MVLLSVNRLRKCIGLLTVALFTEYFGCFVLRTLILTVKNQISAII